MTATHTVDPTATVATQVRLSARPRGLPQASDWHITHTPTAPLGEGGVLAQVLAVSLDPAMRGWMNEGRSYIPPVGLGEVMRAGGVARVVASRTPQFSAGDVIYGTTGVQTHWQLSAEDLARERPHKIEMSLGTPAQWLNVLGMPGMTAYFGLLDVGQPKAGETLVVSGAAGAVGQTVGQLGKLRGLRVVGIAGGRDKCDWVVRELGFDACVDYKASAPAGADPQRWDAVREGLKQHAPAGVDVYFDNVGGAILDTVLTRINRGARIVICGAISQYNNTTAVQGPSNYLSLLVNRARMQGMVVFDYAKRYHEAIAEMAPLLASGQLKSREDIRTGGVEAFPEVLLELFAGGNFGKLVLKLAD